MLRTSSSGSSTRSTLAASPSETSSSSIPSVPSCSSAAALAASDGPSAHYDSKTRKTDLPCISQVRTTSSPAEECQHFLKGNCVRTPGPYLHKGAPGSRKAARETKAARKLNGDAFTPTPSSKSTQADPTVDQADKKQREYEALATFMGPEFHSWYSQFKPVIAPAGATSHYSTQDSNKKIQPTLEEKPLVLQTEISEESEVALQYSDLDSGRETSYKEGFAISPTTTSKNMSSSIILEAPPGEVGFKAVVTNIHDQSSLLYPDAVVDPSPSYGKEPDLDLPLKGRIYDQKEPFSLMTELRPASVYDKFTGAVDQATGSHHLPTSSQWPSTCHLCFMTKLYELDVKLSNTPTTSAAATQHRAHADLMVSTGTSLENAFEAANNPMMISIERVQPTRPISSRAKISNHEVLPPLISEIVRDENSRSDATSALTKFIDPAVLISFSTSFSMPASCPLGVARPANVLHAANDAVDAASSIFLTHSSSNFIAEAGIAPPDDFTLHANDTAYSSASAFRTKPASAAIDLPPVRCCTIEAPPDPPGSSTEHLLTRFSANEKFEMFNKPTDASSVFVTARSSPSSSLRPPATRQRLIFLVGSASTELSGCMSFEPRCPSSDREPYPKAVGSFKTNLERTAFVLRSQIDHSSLLRGELNHVPPPELCISVIDGHSETVFKDLPPALPPEQVTAKEMNTLNRRTPSTAAINCKPEGSSCELQGAGCELEENFSENYSSNYISTSTPCSVRPPSSNATTTRDFEIKLHHPAVDEVSKHRPISGDLDFSLHFSAIIVLSSIFRRFYATPPTATFDPIFNLNALTEDSTRTT